MSNTSLEKRLHQLECHFTWALTEDHIDLSYLQTRLEDQIKLELGQKDGAARAYCFLAYIKHLQGFPEDALTHLQRAEELIREHHGEDSERYLVVTYGNFAWLHFHGNEYGECERYLEKVKAILEKTSANCPGNVPAEVYGEKGFAFLKFAYKYYEKAKEFFNKALELDPEDSEWNAGYAIVLYRTEGSETKLEDSLAIKQLRLALEKKSSDPVLMVLLGLRLADYQKHDEAESLVEEAVEIDPENPYVIRYVGKYLRNNGSVDRSIALLKRALSRTSNSAFLHHQLALCYKTKRIELLTDVSTRRQRHELKSLMTQCIHHLEQATAFHSNFVFAQVELALQYGENKETQKAEEMFQELFSEAREHNNMVYVIHYYYGLFLWYCKRDDEQAVHHFKECLKRKTNERQSEIQAEHCVHQMRKIANRRLSRNPNDEKAYGLLGFVCKEEGEVHEAIANYEKALEISFNEEHAIALQELQSLLQ